MAKHKETPRQKMIGMMYIVLTAMLALNVSKEVLEGFNVVNDSVQATNLEYDQKRKDTYTEFQKEYSLNQMEVGPFLEKANKAKKLSEEMKKYIEKLRDELISTTSGIPIDSAKNASLKTLNKKDNFDIPTHFLLGNSDDGSTGRAHELKNKLIEYRKNMMSLTNPIYRDLIKIGLKTDGNYTDANGKKLSWEVHHFYDIPLAADIPILNKFISEVNNAELEVVNNLLYETNADDFKYDRIEAKVLPKTNYLFPGDEYEAEIIVAAYDTSHSPNPNVYFMRGTDSLSVTQKSNAVVIPRENGHMRIKFPVSSVGQQKVAGFVSVMTRSGKENTYHFKNDYFVALPSVTVSATKMNVLYSGVSNPVSISVAGVPSENIIPTISSGTIRKNGNNGWIAVVPANVREVSITATAKINGGMKRMGSENFRVKRVPNPDPYIGDINNGFAKREYLISSGRISARMPSDFEFDYSYQVVSFKMNMQKGFTDYNMESQSNKLTDEMIQEIKRTNKGQIITFDNIIARGTDGVNIELSPIVLTLK
jgi:gliding motility-associated protein GldM